MCMIFLNYCIFLFLGELYYFDEDGEFNIVLTSKSSIQRILCHESKDICILVCKDLTVAYNKCHKNGSLTEVSKVSCNLYDYYYIIKQLNSQ